MRNVLLVRYGEVFLKGANRPHFLKVLNDNVKKAVKPIGGKVWMSDSRIYVSDFIDLQDCLDRVTKVFGIRSVSPAVELAGARRFCCPAASILRSRAIRS